MQASIIKFQFYNASERHGCPQAINFRTEEIFYIDSLVMHRWYDSEQMRYIKSLLAASNEFIQNVDHFRHQNVPYFVKAFLIVAINT